MPSPEQPEPFAHELRTLLIRRANRLVRTAAHVREGTDAEAVHDVRVAIRRLEAALYVWQDLLAAKALRRARRTLRALRRKAGVTRELEVHAAAICTYRDSAPPELHESLNQIANTLATQAERERARLHARVAPWRVERLARRLRRALQPLAEPPQTGHAPLLQARTRVEQRRRKALTALLATQGQGSDERLHVARLWVKRWRYAEEALAAATGHDLAGEELLRALQSVLGEIQDRATLRDRVLTLSGATKRHDAEELAPALAWLVTRTESERLDAMERFRSQGLPSVVSTV